MSDSRLSPQDSRTPDGRRLRVVLLVLLIVVPACPVFGCCLIPHYLFRASYGRGPVRTNPWPVEKGMTAEEVLGAIGPPHKRYTEEDGEETWIYFHDNLEMDYSGVLFNRDGRVKSTWLH